MRAAIILSVVFAVASCGNGLVQVESVFPTEGPLDGNMFLDLSLTDHDAELEDAPVQGDLASFEVDTSRAYCTSLGGELCLEEDLAPHYALVSIANHNAEPSVGGVTGTAQLNRYSVTIRGLSQGAPEILGYNGFLGVSIAPGRIKTFPVILMGMDGKAEFRNSGETIAHRYGIDFEFRGPGGLSLQAGTTVLVGDFNKCPVEAPVATSFCSTF